MAHKFPELHKIETLILVNMHNKQFYLNPHVNFILSANYSINCGIGLLFYIVIKVTS